MDTSNGDVKAEMSDVFAEKLLSGEKSSTKITIVTKPVVDYMEYRVQDRPPFMLTLAAAIQHVLICFTGSLSTAYVVADTACVPTDSPLRSKLFGTTIFMSGLCTLLQSAIGVRLPIFQGPSASFLVPLIAIKRDPTWSCDLIDAQSETSMTAVTNATTMSTSIISTEINNTSVALPSISEEEQFLRLQRMSGSLIMVSLFEICIGGFGLLNIMLRYIGPITVCVTIALIGTSLTELPIIYGQPSYTLAFTCMALVLLFVFYLPKVGIPLPRCSSADKFPRKKYFYIFQTMPILLAVVLVWIMSAIMTVAGCFSDDVNSKDFQARADANIDVIRRSPWLQITYPAQFGLPDLHVALAMGYFVAILASVMESVGDYHAAQVACCESRPPTHAISRGILIEGIGSMISGLVGAGHATTSYSGNIGILSLTKNGSRMVMYAAGILLIVLSCIGKAGAAFTAIPSPIFGGVLMVVVGTLISIGFSNLKNVDMTSSRNLLVVGVPFMAGLTIPKLLDANRHIIDTGNDDANRIILVVLGTPMFLGGIVSLILDNTVPATRESRGMASHDHGPSVEGDNTDLYSWTWYPRLLNCMPFLKYVPFLPGPKCAEESLDIIAESP